MAKLANLLVMIELLKNGRKYSLDELSRILEVSKRTVREYKLFLEEAGIYVDTIMGPFGGYVLRQDVNLPKVNLGKKDIDVLNSLDLNEDDKMKVANIIDKINVDILESDNREKNIAVADKVLDIYNKLSKALKYHKKVRITYYNLQHGESVRIIYPLALYKFQNEWWVSSYWEDKDDMRQFHLVRMSNVQVLDDEFDPSEINIKF
ncbi:MAG: WYL domain-containing protein [Bacilli bacterium]|nr:WYL domain-containing protein [Bacilli bacterium]